MPRAKTKTAEGQAFAIACPACASSVSSDGKTLFKESERLAELKETFAAFEKIEREFDSLVKAKTEAEGQVSNLVKTIEEHKKTIGVLEQQLKEANARSEKKENVETVRKDGNGSKPARRSDGDEW